MCITDGKLRLVGGRSYYEGRNGRVEVYYNGEWGTVCHNWWSSADADVVCRQLGYGSSGSAYHHAFFGQGSGPIWLDHVACIGNEAMISHCGHLGINVTRSCSHHQDAGVRCDGTQGMYACNRYYYPYHSIFNKNLYTSI